MIQRDGYDKITGGRATISADIHKGQQDKHIASSSNYKNAVKGSNDNPGVYKSVLTADAQALLDKFHREECDVLSAANNRVVVDFKEAIGDVLNPLDGSVIIAATTVGSIRYGKNGAHIFPIGA